MQTKEILEVLDDLINLDISKTDDFLIRHIVAALQNKAKIAKEKNNQP